jgi:hypothetical protein
MWGNRTTTLSQEGPSYGEFNVAIYINSPPCIYLSTSLQDLSGTATYSETQAVMESLTVNHIGPGQHAGKCINEEAS